MSKIHERSAGFVAFRRRNSRIEYLLMKASEFEKNWSTPKGHVEGHETDYQTALREMHEEAGYVADDLKIFKDLTYTLKYKAFGRDKSVIYWLAEVKDPKHDPKLSHEHTEFRWVTIDEAISLVLKDNFTEMITHFHNKLRKAESNEIE